MPFAAVLADGVPGTWLFAFGMSVPAWNWPRPSIVARTSRVGGTNVPAAGPTHAFCVGTLAVHGGRNRQRPRTAPFGGPGSGRIVPQSRSVVAPEVGLISTPYRWIPRVSSVDMPSNRVRAAA